MYVYTDIVDAQFVGDVKVPLLRIVNIEGNVETPFTQVFVICKTYRSN
jgi:hypothetical protein